MCLFRTTRLLLLLLLVCGYHVEGVRKWNNCTDIAISTDKNGTLTAHTDDAIALTSSENGSSHTPIYLQLWIFYSYGFDNQISVKKAHVKSHVKFNYGLWYNDTNTVYCSASVNQAELIAGLIRLLETAKHDDLLCSGWRCYTYTRAKLLVDRYMDTTKLVVRDNYRVGFTITVIICSLVIAIGIFGNGLLILSLKFAKKITKTTTIFMSSLAVGDCLMLLFCLPSEIIRHFFGGALHVGSFFCHFWIFIQHVSYVLSTSTLALIAFERYLAVCHPLHSKIMFTTFRVRIIVIASWILGAAFCTPVLFIIGYTEITAANVVKSRCFMSTTSLFTVYAYRVCLIVAIAIPVLIMILCYSNVIHALYKSSSKKNLTNSHGENTANKQGQSLDANKKQLVRMLLVVIGVFCICWLPYTLFNVINATIRGSVASEDLVYYFSLVAYSNSSMNPLIYSIFSRQFRQQMYASLQIVLPCIRWCGKGRASDTGESKVSQTQSTMVG